MPSIPFLRLSPAAQRLILDNMDLFQLVLFCMLSRKAASIAKSEKRHISELKWTLGRDEMELQVDDKDDDKVTFCLNPTGNGALLIGHLLDLLEIESLEVHFKEEQNLIDCGIWKVTRKLETLYIHEKEDLVTVEEMQFLLEHLQIASLIIDAHVDPGFRWTKPLNVPTLLLQYGSWLTLDTLLSTPFKVWVVGNDLLPFSWLNAFIKKWMVGQARELERFEMCLYPVANEMMSPWRVSGDFEIMDEILEGVRREKDVERPRKWRHITIPHGHDVRNTDGVLATAAVIRARFKFVVWHPQDLADN